MAEGSLSTEVSSDGHAQNVGGAVQGPGKQYRLVQPLASGTDEGLALSQQEYRGSGFRIAPDDAGNDHTHVRITHSTTWLSRLFSCVIHRKDYRCDDDRSNTTKPRGHLPPRHPDSHRRTLVLDLDETLVHSSFFPTNDYDLLVPVSIDGRAHTVFVKKRPHVDEFLIRVQRLYEVVVFTASMPMYADPVISRLDSKNTVSHRLFREHCIKTTGGYIKDLDSIGRDLNHTVIVDNCPRSYSRQPNNSVPVSSWHGEDKSDRSLLDEVLPALEQIASHRGSIYDIREKLFGSAELDREYMSELKLDSEPDDKHLEREQLITSVFKKDKI